MKNLIKGILLSIFTSKKFIVIAEFLLVPLIVWWGIESVRISNRETVASIVIVLAFLVILCFIASFIFLSTRGAAPDRKKLTIRFKLELE